MEQNASILLTGGTGSFDSHFVPMTLEKYNLPQFFIYSRGEMKQCDMPKKNVATKLASDKLFVSGNSKR